MDFLHENDNEVMRNILEPDLFVDDSFEAVPMGMGVTMIVGMLKDQSLVQLQLNPGRQYVQGVKFEKPTWDIQSALEWLQENMKHFEAKDAEVVQANFAKKQMHSIEGVEVFSVGKWNDQSFTEADLDKMVESFNKTSDTVRPFLKLGHDDTQKLLQTEGLPAAGWVSKLYRKGGKLVADFTDIPNKIYELIENRAYRKVSIELFKNVEILEEKFDFLISGVALLGAETPGVLNLKDILDRFKIKSYDSTCTFSHECEQLIIDLDNGGTMNQDLIDAKARIKELEKEKAKQETELANFQKQNAESSKTAAQLEKELKETKEKFAKTAADLKAKEIQAQVGELKASGTITPAMEKGVFQLLSDDVEKFSIQKDDKDVEATKFDLIKHLFDLAKAGDVNTDEQSVDGDPVGTDKKDIFTKIDSEIETYAKENKVSYGEAYTVVTEKYQDQLKAAE